MRLRPALGIAHDAISAELDGRLAARTEFSAKQFFADRPPASTELLCRAAKLIVELQAFSQCIQETPMVRFYSSIDSDDKLLIRQMSCESVFHGIPHQIAAAHSSEDRMPRQRSRPEFSVVLFVSEIRSFWRNVMTFEAAAAEMPLH